MKILPLPVKKNKHGELVANLSVGAYYRQIIEEVLEAHAENVGVFESNEAEELADVITCCITRLNILNDGEKNFDEYVSELLTEAERDYTEPEDFYTDLAFKVMQGFCLSSYSFYERKTLSRIIVMCVKRLESMGYDETRREKLYAAVNEKNRRRGYLEGFKTVNGMEA